MRAGSRRGASARSGTLRCVDVVWGATLRRSEVLRREGLAGRSKPAAAAPPRHGPEVPPPRPGRRGSADGSSRVLPRRPGAAEGSALGRRRRASAGVPTLGARRRESPAGPAPGPRRCRGPAPALALEAPPRRGRAAAPAPRAELLRLSFEFPMDPARYPTSPHQDTAHRPIQVPLPKPHPGPQRKELHTRHPPHEPGASAPSQGPSM